MRTYLCSKHRTGSLVTASQHTTLTSLLNNKLTNGKAAVSLLMWCRYRSGTSQAVPYVAAAAAIYLQNNTGEHDSHQHCLQASNHRFAGA